MAGLVERGGRIITNAVTDVAVTTLTTYIETNVKKGSAILTDEHLSYREIVSRGYEQSTSTSTTSGGSGPDGRAGTITLEVHWSLVKRSIRGTYGAISAEQAPFYLAEFS